jgi:hypothetical protein
MKLGKREIDALTCPPGQRDTLAFDDDLTGFALRVTRDGTKTFLFQYRRGVAVRRVRIGRYGDVTPTQARRIAENLRGRVAAGEDPAAERLAELAAEATVALARQKRVTADALTFDKLIDQWEQRQLRHRSVRYRVEAVRALRFSLAAFKKLPADAIDATMVRQALSNLPTRPRGKTDAEPKQPPRQPEAMHLRVHSYGRAMYGWAVKQGLLADNPFAAVAPDGRVATRERFLNDAELGEVWRAAGELGWPWGPYFRFLLLTLQREVETAGLRRPELSADLALWELPGARTKNGRPQMVHLAEPARAILRAAPRIGGSDLVFTTTGRTRVSGFSHAKLRLDAKITAARAKAAKEAGTDPAPLVPWRLHDFRRTGVTAMARLGVRWEVADRLLNHVQGAIHGVAAIYQRHDYLAEREAALKLWAAHVVAVGEGGGGRSNVIVMRPGGAAAAP